MAIFIDYLNIKKLYTYSLKNLYLIRCYWIITDKKSKKKQFLIFKIWYQVVSSH